MLVMTTIFISKLEGLPRTSDTKMIDYWLILCQLVPFTEVILITAMEYLREEATQPIDEQEIRDMKNVAQTQFKTYGGVVGKNNKVVLVKTLKTIGKDNHKLNLYPFFFHQKQSFCR